MRVLNYGSLNYDYVYEVDHFVNPGETMTSKSMTRFFGGKGLNQSIALKRAGADVYHAGMIGMDGKAFLDLLDENEIPTKYLRMVDDMNGHAIIQVSASGENCILLYEGANGKNTVEQMEQVLKEFEAGDFLLIQNEINGLEDLVKRSYEKEMKIILNPSPYNERLTEEILKRVSIFIMNEVEGAQITGKLKPEEILDEMKHKYPDAAVLLTLGSKGSMYQDAKGRIQCASHKVEVVDTTAAGDTYTGYFVASIQKGLSVEESMKFATKAAAIAVTRKGATPSIPSLQEVDESIMV